MVHKVGKLEQHKLLLKDPICSQYIPASTEYKIENLSDFLNRYPTVYIKHDSSGQGRGVYKVTKDLNSLYKLDGFSLEGKIVNQKLTIQQIHHVLQPFEKLGRLHSYIIQEGIHSVTNHGQPLNIRVHSIHFKGEWIIGGMYASLGFNHLEDNGVININRGSKAVTIHDLLVNFLGLNEEQEHVVMNKLSNISIAVSKVITNKYDSRECGIDVGLDQHLKPIIFEVNTTPGIGGFHKVDKKLWKHIVELRKDRNL